MTAAFWLCLGLVVYCYFGYPLLVWLWARLKPRPVARAPIEPAVSVVISLYNEEDVIVRKLENLRQFDYPADKIEVLIGSDGSTDRTEEMVRSFADTRIRLFQYDRRGKTAVVNDLVSKAAHEIVLLTDARQTFDRDTLRKLVANFADPTVGCVSGELMFTGEDGATAKGVGAYWKYEKFIRAQESRVHSMLGATGAIYAIRKALFVPAPANIVLDDMYTPFKIIEQGFRAVFEEGARAYDRAAQSPKEEHRRKARTLFGNYQIFALFPRMFNPFVSPIALQLFSHKFLRVAAPFVLIALFILNFLLYQQLPYTWFMAAQAAFYAMAAAGGMLREKTAGGLQFVAKLCYIPYVFCLMNFSALIGFWRFVCSNQQATWQKAREQS